MKAAYVDTSVMVAIVNDEPNGRRLTARCASFDRLYSSNLLEAEFRAFLKRDNQPVDAERALEPIHWVLPPRSLGPEVLQVLTVGYLRGADLWHLASALFLSPDPSRISFLSLDKDQIEIAKALGFKS